MTKDSQTLDDKQHTFHDNWLSTKNSYKQNFINENVDQLIDDIFTNKKMEYIDERKYQSKVAKIKNNRKKNNEKDYNYELGALTEKSVRVLNKRIREACEDLSDKEKYGNPYNSCIRSIEEQVKNARNDVLNDKGKKAIEALKDVAGSIFESSTSDYSFVANEFVNCVMREKNIDSDVEGMYDLKKFAGYEEDRDEKGRYTTKYEPSMDKETKICSLLLKKEIAGYYDKEREDYYGGAAYDYLGDLPKIENKFDKIKNYLLWEERREKRKLR